MCIPAEHESAAKQIIYARIFGLAHLRGFATRAPIFQIMQSLTIKRTIWRFFDVAKPVELKVKIVTPPTSESACGYTTAMATPMTVPASPSSAPRAPRHNHRPREPFH